MNLEKRIKRHVIGSRLDFFAATLPGCEASCRLTLEGLSETISVQDTIRAGVMFSGRLTDLYLANLHLRTAGRVLMRVASFKATAFHQLEKKASAIAWSLYLPSGAIPRRQATAHHSRLHHSGAIEERIGRCIATHWEALGVAPAHDPGQCLFIRLQDDRVTLSLDSSGDNLYRRGVKTHGSRAPLRETTAAFVLTRSGYRPDRPLVDPMCGSGTFSLEAALMAKAIPAGFFRRFAFMQWPAFRERQWQYLKKNAARKIKRMERPLIWASDQDPAACADLSACAATSGLEDAIRVCCMDFFSLQAHRIDGPPGLIVLNPPYGRRLGTDAGVADFYRRIAIKLTHDFKHWRIALLVPGKHLARTLPLPAKAFALKHGGLNVALLTGMIGKEALR
jgi:putative N6-adenine-specific DNA methylase